MASTRFRAMGTVVAVVTAAVLAASTAPVVAAEGPPERAAAVAAASDGRTPGDRVRWSGSMESLVPARILDTRTGNGAARAKVGRGRVVELQVAGRGGVPTIGAGAVALNVTATRSTSSGYLTVWPTGAARPHASSVNLVAGGTVANTVVAKLGVDGKVSIYNSGDATDVVVDVTGWFPEGGSVEPLVPTRLLDTRSSGARVPVGPGGTRELRVTGVGGVPATGVAAVVLNVTVTEPTAAEGYLTVWPTGAPRPVTSNLNFVRRQTVPNAVVAKVGANGRISIFNSSGSSHVVVDVVGWFPDPGGIEPLVPARLLDTRKGIGAPTAPVGPRGTLAFKVTGRGGVPSSGVGAVVLNVTSTASTAESYLTVWPTGAARPTASSLNFTRGRNVPNLVVAKVGSGGRVSVFNNAGSSHVLADVVGWFPDGSAAPTTTIQPYTDTVVVGAGDVVARTGDSMTGGTVTLAPSADLPAPGDPILAMQGRVAGEGVVGLVSSVAPGAGGTTVVTYDPTDIGSVLADFEESYEGPMAPRAASASPARAAMGDVGVAAGAAGSGGNWDFSPFEGIECTGAAGTQLTGIDFDMLGLGASWDVDLSDRRVHFVLTATPSLTATMAASGGFSCTYSQSVGNWPIGSLWVEPSLEMSLTGTFDGNFTTTASAPVSLGFAYDDGGQNLSSANLAGSALFHTDEAGGTVSLDVGVSLAARLFGRVGVEGSFGMALSGQLDPAEQPCVTVELAPTIGFGVTVDLWLADWNFSILDFDGEPITLFSANPDPPCEAIDVPLWTGVIDVEVHEHFPLYDHRNDFWLTVTPKPRPKGIVGYDDFQAAHVEGRYDGYWDCRQYARAAGSYEDPFEIVYPWSGDVVSSPGGFFLLGLTPDPWGEHPDEVRLEGIFTYDNQILGEMQDCEWGWEPSTGHLQWPDGRSRSLCESIMVSGVQAEIASSGQRDTLGGSGSETIEFDGNSFTCAISWQLTRLPDPDGDGFPG